MINDGIQASVVCNPKSYDISSKDFSLITPRPWWLLYYVRKNFASFLKLSAIAIEKITAVNRISIECRLMHN
jgi:hypothetical protein